MDVAIPARLWSPKDFEPLRSSMASDGNLRMSMIMNLVAMLQMEGPHLHPTVIWVPHNQRPDLEVVQGAAVMYYACIMQEC